MIKGKSVLAIIPARGGSKGVPRKNLRDVAGKPLIAWTIEEAKKSKYIDRMILSSEDTEIIKVAKQWGCDVPFIRPLELAQDMTPGIEPVLHAISMLSEFDYVVLLQPTSPLRSVKDIDGCIEKCLLKKGYSCVSVTESDESPYWMYLLSKEDEMIPVMDSGKRFNRRQDLPKVYALNGAVYVAQTKWLQQEKTFINDQSIAYCMPKERAIDIDTELDLIYLQTIIAGGYYGKD